MVTNKIFLSDVFPDKKETERLVTSVRKWISDNKSFKIISIKGKKLISRIVITVSYEDDNDNKENHANTNS